MAYSSMQWKVCLILEMCLPIEEKPKNLFETGWHHLLLLIDLSHVVMIYGKPRYPCSIFRSTMPSYSNSTYLFIQNVDKILPTIVKKGCRIMWEDEEIDCICFSAEWQSISSVYRPTRCLLLTFRYILSFKIVLNVKTGEILKESILLKLFQSNLFLNVKTERRISAVFIWKGCSRGCILSQHLYCLCNFYILFHLSRRVWIENCFLLFKLTCFMFFRVYMWLRNTNRNQRRGRVGQICRSYCKDWLRVRL